MSQPSNSSSSIPRPSPSADTPSLFEPGALHFDTDRLPWQRSLRWADPPRDRRLLAWGLLFAVLVTVLQLVGFALGMRSYHAKRTTPHATPVVQVVLIEPEQVIPPPPEPEPPEFQRRPSKIAIAPPRVNTPPPAPRPAEASDEMRARIGSAGSAAPPPRLFNPDGSIRMDSSAAPLAPAAAPVNPREAAKARWAQIEKRGNPLDCKKTRFAQAFATDESAGDRIASKYLKWIGLADGEAIAHRRQQRAQAGGCEPSK